MSNKLYSIITDSIKHYMRYQIRSINYCGSASVTWVK